jgi:hypothetical protein
MGIRNASARGWPENAAKSRLRTSKALLSSNRLLEVSGGHQLQVFGVMHSIC